MDEQIEVGDYVTIGKNKLTWEVLELSTPRQSMYPWARIRSGQSGRVDTRYVVNLRLHTKGSK